MRVFNYTGDSVVTANTKFNISIDSLMASTATYNIGTPIYLIEERTYTLTGNNLQLAQDSGTPQTLLSGIQTFKVSARVYKDKSTKTSDPIDGTGLPVARSTTPVCSLPLPSPSYICTFKTSAYPNDDWKILQGIKVDLQAKYDPTGQNATPTQASLDKLTASAEFFPRNVLSE